MLSAVLLCVVFLGIGVSTKSAVAHVDVSSPQLQGATSTAVTSALHAQVTAQSPIVGFRIAMRRPSGVRSETTPHPLSLLHDYRPDLRIAAERAVSAERLLAATRSLSSSTTSLPPPAA